MCLAEALLRIPDTATQDLFIEDQLASGNWSEHLGSSEHFFVNASTFGLMVAGRTVTISDTGQQAVERIVRKLGAPAVRIAVRRAMRVLGRQFVYGETIDQALERAASDADAAYSFDMLGESAWTAQDAELYFERYCLAIASVKAAAAAAKVADPQISVKLSALHPRFEFSQRDRVGTELLGRLLELCRLAADASVGLFIDAEEADRLELCLSLFEGLAFDTSLRGWDGLGMAVQAYQKRALPVLEWLDALAAQSAMRFSTRLVKGAYWDTEIKLAQERGLADFPVFTRKVNTDVSYLACAARLLGSSDRIVPCFATHNAYTLAAVLEMAGPQRDLEFQRLHGMGEALYERVLRDEQLRGNRRLTCRVYAPVGQQVELLAYLVRRLLENGANTSFVNRITDDALDIEEVVRDPVAQARQDGWCRHPHIRLPAALFEPDRCNSLGLDLNDADTVSRLADEFADATRRTWRSAPVIGGELRDGDLMPVTDPVDPARRVGSWVSATPEDALAALDMAAGSANAWRRRCVAERADLLRGASDALEAASAEFMYLLCREGGRCLNDAHLEVREAVDFLRYYAFQAEQTLTADQPLPGPTGEQNTLRCLGRGAFLCISPWNFPLAIFTGQIAAALVAGNSVLAKPAEQTPLIAAAMVRLLHEAGIPGEVLHLLPGDGPTLAAPLLADARLAGVAFTGSLQAARAIGKALADRAGPMVPFIAETGGVNAMIVDATALPEQVTRDALQACEERARQRFPVLAEASSSTLSTGWFVRPVAFEVAAVADVPNEIFGPYLHVLRWRADALETLVDEINALGYGLTLSIHSRSRSRVRRVADRARVGNVYINRNQIGAVVGSQPFGGEGLSGTGPKAGGPNYLQRFVVEQTLSADTTAAGGNASLLTLDA